MRITIEMTESEGRSTTVSRQMVGAGTTGSAGGEGPAADGGPPPEALLMALGVQSQPGMTATTGGDQDAGEPSSWLVDAITSGRRSNQPEPTTNGGRSRISLPE